MIQTNRPAKAGLFFVYMPIDLRFFADIFAPPEDRYRYWQQPITRSKV